MKQINKRYLCYWCMGCTAQGEEDYVPRQRCKRFYAKCGRLARKMEGANEKWQSINLK